MSFRVQQIGGEDPRHSCICLGDNMSELSLFIDESGDFGPYKPDTSFYIVSMVLHDQSNPITEQMLALDSDWSATTCVLLPSTLAPVTPRRRIPQLDLARTTLSSLRAVSLRQKCDLKYKVFSFDRRTCRTPGDLERKVSREITSFIRENHKLFASYDTTILYYDDGQKQLAHILSDIDELIINIDHRHLDPTDYRLYRLAQVADLACCLELTKLHFDTGQPTNSERYVFGNARNFRKSFYKAFRRNQL